MKAAKRRFTTAAGINPAKSPPKISNPLGISTCKFCRKIVKSTEDSISPCQCEGVSGKVHRHCLTTYILSLKNQLCLQAKCATCDFPYQYTVESNRKCHCCALNVHSKKLYCCLGALTLISFWLAIMCYCFANENGTCFVYTGTIWGVCSIAYIWVFFHMMCMEESKIVFLQEYKPLARSRSAKDLGGAFPEGPKEQSIEEVRIEIEGFQQGIKKN